MSINETRNFVKIPDNEGDGPSWIAIGIITACQLYPVSLVLLYIKLRKMWSNHKLDNYRSILRAIGDDNAASIKQLARTCGKARSDVITILNEMIAKGYLGPEAYIDRSKGMLYIVKPVYNEQAHRPGVNVNFDLSDLSGIFSGISGIASDVASTLKREFSIEFGRKSTAGHAYTTPGTSAAQPEPEPQPQAKPEPQPQPKDDSEKTASEAAVDRLRALNDQIDDPEVSRKVDRIAELTRDIYAFVEQNPDREGEVRKFMNYYLPTTMKLLTSYGMLEKQSYQGENIVNARRDIEQILDTLVHAFEKQLDQLFATDAVDISSDISVLETMIAKDGLRKDEKGIKLQI